MRAQQGVAVSLNNISKRYPNGFEALRGVNLQIEPGEWLVLVGPSGCGKTTTLRLIAGLEEPTAGTISIGGQDVSRVPPWRRNVSMVFQRPALAPTHTVRQNLSFGTKDSNDAEVLAIADLLSLTGEFERLPHQLSGGQQQRVALGRALVRRAWVFLLDEPLGHLDAPLRDELRRELQRWHQRRPATVISVTHDPREAWAMGQRVAVMDQGRIVQTGPPAEVYQQPCNRFVAAFFAQGPMNFFEVQLRSQADLLQWGARDWPHAIPRPPAVSAPAEATLGLRAEHVSVVPAGETTLEAALVERTPSGSWVTGVVHGRSLTGWSADAVSVGQKVGITMDWTKAYVFDRVTGKTLHAPLG